MGASVVHEQMNDICQFRDDFACEYMGASVTVHEPMADICQFRADFVFV